MSHSMKSLFFLVFVTCIFGCHSPEEISSRSTYVHEWSTTPFDRFPGKERDDVQYAKMGVYLGYHTYIDEQSENKYRVEYLADLDWSVHKIYYVSPDQTHEQIMWDPQSVKIRLTAISSVLDEGTQHWIEGPPVFIATAKISSGSGIGNTFSCELILPDGPALHVPMTIELHNNGSVLAHGYPVSPTRARGPAIYTFGAVPFQRITIESMTGLPETKETWELTRDGWVLTKFGNNVLDQ